MDNFRGEHAMIYITFAILAVAVILGVHYWH